jgi:nucleotide-binding universal stress UspA family protein
MFGRSEKGEAPAMSDATRALRAIVSYDGTDTDRDALALGATFAMAGCELTLAYVRHVAAVDRSEEMREQRDAEAMLSAGAASIGMPEIPQAVVWSPATGAGLTALARQEGADLVIFGSDYRTAPGSVSPGASAEQLLDGGAVAVALASARVHEAGPIELRTICSINEGEDVSAHETAASLAGRLGATVVESARHDVDLLVIGSQAGVPEGRVALSGAARYALETARSSVLVLPRGVVLSFAARTVAGA